MRKSDDTFGVWFRRQFGTRPKGRSDQELVDCVCAGEQAKADLACRRQWDANQTAALYAWCARDVRQKRRRK